MQTPHHCTVRVGLFGLLLCVLPILQACTATTHPAQTARLGEAIRLADMERLLDEPAPAGAVALETFTSADWVADLSVVLNLDAPAAKAAGLVDRQEPIQVYVYALRHPSRGLYLIDTGYSAKMAHDSGSLGAGWILQRAMHLDQLQFHLGPADILKRETTPLQGVFLTHAHPDHTGGLSEIPLPTPIFVGPGEDQERHWTHFFTQAVIDRAMQHRPALQTWNFPRPVGAQAPDLAAVDVFGDGTVFALSVPGHTRGSTAYLVRTATGPVLLTGDACHTRWGWEQAVEPGSASVDGALNRSSLLQLKALVARHPQVQVRVGHQH